MIKIKLLSLFSGIGAFEKALARLEIKYDLVNYCEIDKYASKAYSLIHNVNQNLNLWDVQKINENNLPDFDLLTWGFPCQDVSIAGTREGLKKGTRSGLYYEGLRILKSKKPKYSIIENVDSLISKRYINSFNQILKDLESIGYKNYWQILNALDYGIPQHRKRIFIVSIRKDLNKEYSFPEPIGCKNKLADLLEDDIDSKYILSEKEIVYMNRKTRDGRTHWDFQHHHDTAEKYAHCIPANLYKGVPYNVIIDRRFNPVLYRKLTPLEAFRLMGFDDNDFHVVKNGLNKCFYRGKDRSDTQLFKMAGNSIVVNVLEQIFKELWC